MKSKWIYRVWIYDRITGADKNFFFESYGEALRSVYAWQYLNTPVKLIVEELK